VNAILTPPAAPYTGDSLIGPVSAHRQMRLQTSVSVAKRALRLDELRFIRSWLEKPLATGAVAPSSKALARTMASYVDCSIEGPVVELGPGTGAVTEALVEHGVAVSRLVLIEFNPVFCRLLRARYPEAVVVQGDAYALRRLLCSFAAPAAVVSGLPLMTKPFRLRNRLMADALELMVPGGPFIQFTYAMVGSPITRRPPGVLAEVSKPIWMNLPPARVWVYRRGRSAGL
jgi:phosphatidylethanolamine/phosphatidyl-N-methylethanolamine N-methyltransferase